MFVEIIRIGIYAVILQFFNQRCLSKQKNIKPTPIFMRLSFVKKKICQQNIGKQQRTPYIIPGRKNIILAVCISQTVYNQVPRIND